MGLAFSRRLAIVLGVLLPIGETIRRWGTWGFWPYWLDDYIIGAFLLYAAWRSGRDARGGQRYLVAAWGFACGMGYASFFGHLKNIHQPDPAPIPHVALTAIIGAGWVLVILALAASLRGLPGKT